MYECFSRPWQQLFIMLVSNLFNTNVFVFIFILKVIPVCDANVQGKLPGDVNYTRQLNYILAIRDIDPV